MKKNEVESMLNAVFLFPVQIPLYRSEVIFMYGDDYKMFAQWVKEDNLEDSKLLLKDLKSLKKRQKSYSGTYFVGDSGRRLIHVKKQDTLPSFMNILSHEIYHTVYHILQHVGIPPSDTSEEAYAYLTGYLTEQILNEVLSKDQ